MNYLEPENFELSFALSKYLKEGKLIATKFLLLIWCSLKVFY